MHRPAARTSLPLTILIVVLTALLWKAAAGCEHNQARNSAPGGTVDDGAGESSATEPPTIRLASSREARSQRFATALACVDCHSNAPTALAMRDGDGRPVAPFDLWQATMMANAARDPLFRAVLAAEMRATPAIADVIQNKCLTCHSPMMAYERQAVGELARLESLYRDDTEARLALDGVSCTVCHQITAKGLGAPESFSGRFTVTDDRLAFGPHADPFARPMDNRSGYYPVRADHVRESRMCASCHTLFTDAHAPDGTPLGTRLPEQTPYLEWRNSVFSTEGDAPGPEAASCQDCHVPTVDEDERALRTAIARRPDGSDFPPVVDRAPYGRHVFIGGNTLIPAILRDHADELNPLAPPQAFDRIIELTTEQLAQRTGRLAIEHARRTDGAVSFAVRVENLTGHKFPTGYPSRRAWLRVQVLDEAGNLLAVSGDYDAGGRLVDGGGRPLPSETVGGPIQPHHVEITGSDQVQVYEAIMADGDGEPTMRLMRGATYLKDNRLLPRGWRADHPDAEHTRPAGVDGDEAFTDGTDTVRFRLPVAGAAGLVTVKAELLYQTLSARFASELFTFDAPEVHAFRRYFESADRAPVTVAIAEVKVP
jgi:hypothetical protein